MKSNSKETDRIKEPSEFAIKFANTVFMLGILFSFLVSVYAVNKILYYFEFHLSSIHIERVDLTFYLSCLLFATLTIIFLSFGLRKFSNELKVNMSVLFIMLAISVYGCEIYLELSREKKNPGIPFTTRELKRQIKAEQLGIPFDTRIIWEVLEELNDTGANAYLNELGLLPRDHVVSNGFNTFKGKIFPLGKISNITTINPNESGYYPIIETDEHGFNNPKELYQENKVDIMLLGDSFAEGYSVHSNETIAAVLRESGFNAISVGTAGNGSLLNFATLIEYAKPLKPKIVLWLYFINDLGFLEQEMKSSLLRKYLNQDNFSQNLITRQKEIDSILMSHVQGLLELVDKETILGESKEEEVPARKIIHLRNLRARLSTLFPPSLSPIIKDNFYYMLQKSKQMVSNWDGKMYFVYLSDFGRYSTGKEDYRREIALSTVDELEIPIMDIHSEVFALHPDPLSLFPFRIRGHYTADGYRLVAEAIENRLKKDGSIPQDIY